VFNVTARFLAEVRISHRVESYVVITSPTQETFRLSVIGGDVSVDRSASTRRTCRLVCVDNGQNLIPENAESILTPYGTIIQPYRGVRYSDGTVEVVPLGTFRLSKVDIKDKVGGSPDISLEGFDRSREVARDKFIEVYTVAVGTNVVTAIKAILTRTFPDLTYDSISSSLTTTATAVYDTGSDPWEAVTKLAASIGCEIFFDTDGSCVIAPPVDIDALPSPSFTFIEGNGCTMLDLAKVFTDEPGFNGVVVTGESPGDDLPPVRAVVWDDQPTSATYHLGPYGEVPMFVTDQVVTTVGDAFATAKSILASQLGFSSQLSINTSTNPALDAGDVIEVARNRVKVSGLYVIDTITIPLAASGTQALTLRQKRLVL
jgi:hypothetical protein